MRTCYNGRGLFVRPVSDTRATLVNVAFAVLVVALLMGAALAVTGQARSVAGSATAGRAPSVKGAAPVDYSAWVHRALGDPALLPNATVGEGHAYVAYLSGLSPTEFARYLRQPGPTAASVEIQSGLRTMLLGFTWGSLTAGAGGALTSCASGVLIGIALGVGTGPGCALGITLGLLASWFATANNGNLNTVKWEKSMAATLANEMNLSSADFQTVLSTLNSTIYALETEAANAALNQLGNSTFSAANDLSDSGVAAQLSSLQAVFVADVNVELGFFQLTVRNNLNVLGGDTWDNFDGSGGSLVGNVGAFADVQALGNAGNTRTQFFYAPTQSTDFLFVSGGGSCVIHPVETHSNITSDKTYSASTWLNWTFGSGVYQVNATTSPTTCEVRGASIIGLNPGNGSLAANTLGPRIGYCAPTLGCSVFANASVSLTSPLGTAFKGVGNCFGTVIASVWTPNTPCFPTGTSVWRNYQTEFNNLEFAATNSGNTYWTFLRSLGYHSISQVPPGCIIPYPSQALPPAWSTAQTNFTTQQYYSLYMAWMNGLAVFFNVPPGTSGFCAGSPIFHFGGTLWTNLYVNVFGFVYTPNATLFPAQKWVNASLALTNNQVPQALLNSTTQLATWALNDSVGIDGVVNTTTLSKDNNTYSCWLPEPPTTGPPKLAAGCSTAFAQSNAKNATQLLIWPLTGNTVNVPVGRTFVTPSVTPMAVFSTESNVYYSHVTGNGSVSGFKSGTTAGGSIFISSCKVNATFVSTCPLSLSTINGTIANISSSGTGAITNPSSPACGQTLPVWATVVAAFASFTGQSALGCLVAETLALITIIVVVVIVVGVVAVVRRR